MPARRPSLNELPRVWDTAILLLIALGAGAAMLSVSHMRQPDIGDAARLFWIACGLLGFCGSFLVFYGSFIEPKRLYLNKKCILFPHPAKIRIAVVGDLHVGDYKGAAFVERVVRNVNALEADIVLLVGDFLDGEASNIEDLAPLRALRARFGTFAVTGNHDAGYYTTFRTKTPYRRKDRTEEVRATLESFGIQFLRNTAHFLTIAGEPIAIAGIDDVWMESSSLDRAFAGIVKDTPLILLSHSPDVILQQQSRRAHLIVSGHTHGGQIRLPLIGPLAGIPDKLGRAFDRGLFYIGSTTTLAITAGAGETLARARLFCRPEILVLETTGD